MRLISQDDVDDFNARMTEFRDELTAAVDNLDEHFEQLKAAARDRLGALYNPADYPPTLRGLFGVEFDFPSVEPPEYLLRLNPDLYQQERQRIAQRFDEAVRLAEEAFVGEFSKLVSHLTERLTADPWTASGRSSVTRRSPTSPSSSSVSSRLNVRSNADLDRLVETAQQVLAGRRPARRPQQRVPPPAHHQPTLGRPGSPRPDARGSAAAAHPPRPTGTGGQQWGGLSHDNLRNRDRRTRPKPPQHHLR